MKQDKKDEKTQLNIAKDALAEQLGIEPNDIGFDDSFSDDFHMRPTDFADFLEVLNSKNIDTSKLDLPEIETFGDLVYALDIEDQL